MLYTNQSLDLFSRSLFAHDWSVFSKQCDDGIDTNILYDSFLAVIMKLYDAAFPLKQIKKT